MEYMAYCKNNNAEFTLKYNSEYRNKSKENKADLILALKEYCKLNNISMEDVEIIDTKNITKRKRSEKTKTSAEAKMRWENKTYRKYTVTLNNKAFVIRLRNEDDKSLIEYIESQRKKGIEITELVRCALNVLRKCELDK